MAKIGMGLILAGGAALALATTSSTKKKKGKKKNGNGIGKPGATVNGLADMLTGPIAIRQQGSDISFRDFVKYPTESESVIRVKFPADFANSDIAGNTISAKFFVQGPNFGKIISEAGEEFDLPGTESVRHLVIDIKPEAAKKLFAHFRTAVIQGGSDYSIPSGTLDQEAAEAIEGAGGTVTEEVLAGAELIAQLAYQSVWNSHEE